MAEIAFAEIGRLPDPGDNAAIATRRLRAGSAFRFGDDVFATSYEIPEGHRFAVHPVAAGDYLLSWGLPFGRALRAIKPGEYLCNDSILQALQLRAPGIGLPAYANFADYRDRFELSIADFRPGQQVRRYDETATFKGFERPGTRGAGTRNFVVLLGTTSLTASFCKALENLCIDDAASFDRVDGICAIAHTEGGEPTRPNNMALLLRTLAGFIVNPNVGAVLIVDYGTEVVNNARLKEYMREHGYALDDVPHLFYSIDDNFGLSLRTARQIISQWLPAVNAVQRIPQPVSALKVALQCGGSDAFSGVSGNPLAGWVAKEIIRHGGSAALAETDELIGAEPYLLANTRDLETARCFLQKVNRFEKLISWHGCTSEGNTTGGNKLRGLYNNAIKSIGAARKKDPEVRLDFVIDYAQRMTDAGFYFMDSPGNDLESIAGQVAAGCNLIFFVTGNGSITNFPFVPTVKFMTTTSRWNLLAGDMDVNAGRYQDGTPMDELGMETFEFAVDIASGKRSVGERAGHSQVSIWRDWRQTDATRLHQLQQRPAPEGEPIAMTTRPGPTLPVNLCATECGGAVDRVGLIVPTSLCAGQIALRIAARLDSTMAGADCAVSRFVALPHTEGCGASSGENEVMYLRTMAGHLVHPFVVEALLLEHGCEHTHNDLVRTRLQQLGIDPGRFGYASIQLDGGIEKVQRKVANWFETALAGHRPVVRKPASFAALSVALIAVAPLPEFAAAAFAVVASSILSAGGTVLLAEESELLKSAAFLDFLGLQAMPAPSIDYGEFGAAAGLHVMRAPTRHVVEILSGMGGSGAQLMLAWAPGAPVQGHPLVPLVQVASAETTGALGGLDYLLDPDSTSSEDAGRELLQLLSQTAGAEFVPRLWAQGNTSFQLTRGLLGVSL